MRDRQLNSVVLPAPLGPMRPTIWPSATSKLTSSRATMPPNRTVRWRTDRTTGREGDTTALIRAQAEGCQIGGGPLRSRSASRVGAQPALPQVFPLAGVLADPAAQDEEEIAEAVEIAQRPLRDRLHPRQREQVPLGTTADRARLVQEGV